MGSFFSFLRDVIADVKTSWRFRVAAIIWIPLIIVSGILVVRFGIRHTLSAKFQEFKTTFIPQTTVTYPDVLLFVPQQGSVACWQYTQGAQSPAIVVTPGCSGVQQPGWSPNYCYQLPLSKKTTTQTQNDWFGQPIHCNVTQPGWGSTGNNDIFWVVLPGGINQNSGWNFEGRLEVRPNARIGIQLFHELFFGWGNKVDNWFGVHQYETSIFYPGDSAYTTSIHFDIPFNALEVNWEEDGFDSWFLLATWGGGLFFFYLLFLMAFNIAKFFLPDDSRILRSGAEGTAAPLIS